MIIVKLNGGLGNQMFQYAYGRALQERFGDELFLDVEEFRRTYGHEPRHYSLEAFNLPETVKILSIKESKTLLPWKILHKLNRSLNVKIASLFHVYWWRSSGYRALNVKDTRNRRCYFYGYWQSERYFHEISQIIRTEFEVKTDFLDDSRLYLPDIVDKNSVCVHIRRGDYVTQNMIACDEEYYLKGMKYIRDQYQDANFLIFTDDIQWVKENIHFQFPVRYVEMQDPDYEVLRLMYMCRHFVISNSSFSWWAQYLGTAKNKIVVAPRIWHAHNPNERSIYQDSWILM